MDATFRRPRSQRTTAVWCLLGFVAWSAMVLLAAWFDKDAKNQLALAAMLAGLPLFMAGLCLWTLLDYWRAELTFQGKRVASRGVFQTREIDLSDVTDVRWSVAGTVVLQTASNRITIRFSNHDEHDHEQIVQHLRSMLLPELQSGWNLFTHKTRYGKPPLDPHRKPGPDEFRITRKRWSWYFVPLVVIGILGGILASIITGELRYLLAPLFPLGMWGLFGWMMTPAQGMITHKLVRPTDPESQRLLIFFLYWVPVGVVGVLLSELLRRRSANPEAMTIVWPIIWFTVLIVEGGLSDYRKARRDREAADLAAKARGDAVVDTWPIE
jgi:hypothetical protein